MRTEMMRCVMGWDNALLDSNCPDLFIPIDLSVWVAIGLVSIQLLISCLGIWQ